MMKPNNNCTFGPANQTELKINHWMILAVITTSSFQRRNSIGKKWSKQMSGRRCTIELKPQRAVEMESNQS